MLFIKYKKEFKKLLNYYHATGSRSIRSDIIGIEREKLEYLAAHCVIRLTPLNNVHKYYKITLTDYGLRFYDDEHDKLFRFWVPITISALSLIISVIALMK